jgi:hypothetical protein
MLNFLISEARGFHGSGVKSDSEEKGRNEDNELNPDARLEVFGQEINPESYAICKSDMLIKGQNPSSIKFGNTFTQDGLEGEVFDYMLSNPPFGVERLSPLDFLFAFALLRVIDFFMHAILILFLLFYNHCDLSAIGIFLPVILKNCKQLEMFVLAGELEKL